MNNHLQHQGAHQFTPSNRPLAGAPRALDDWHEFSNRDAHGSEAIVIPLASASDHVLATGPGFSQDNRMRFASLSERIASQAAGQTPSFESDEVFEPSGRGLNVRSVLAVVSATLQNPQSPVLTILLALLVGFFVYRYVTG